jgi:predicted nucleic acid-binding protein
MDIILLDTSFCIRLLKSNDDLHLNSKDYFNYFLEKKIEIYLSSIVIAEYSVKDDPTKGGQMLRNIHIKPAGQLIAGQTAGF